MTEKPYRGSLTIAAPGLADPWTRTIENYGSQNLRPPLDTAITLPRNGFYAQEPLARAVQSSKRNLASYSGWRENLSWAEAGSKARFPELAEIYAAVARKGVDAFCRSRSTEVLIDELRQRGLPVTYTGFAEHRHEKVTPIKCAWRDCSCMNLRPTPRDCRHFNSQVLSR